MMDVEARQMETDKVVTQDREQSTSEVTQNKMVGRVEGYQLLVS
jgi:hypothetical protein